jgi:hypothetical protein
VWRSPSRAQTTRPAVRRVEPEIYSRAVELRERVEQPLPVLLNRLDTDDRARTAPRPGGDGGSRDGDVLGHASGAAADHLLPEAMVVRAARPRRGREGVHHHEDSTARDSTTIENPNDTRGADVGYTKTRNFCARSCDDFSDTRGHCPQLDQRFPSGPVTMEEESGGRAGWLRLKAPRILGPILPPKAVPSQLRHLRRASVV